MLLLRLSILVLLAMVISDARKPRQHQPESVDDNAIEASYNKPKSVRRHGPKKPYRVAVRPRFESNQRSKIRKTKVDSLRRKKKMVKRARPGALRRSGPRRVPKVHKKPHVPSKPKSSGPKKPNKRTWTPDLDTIANSLDIANGVWDLVNKGKDASETESEDQPPTTD